MMAGDVVEGHAHNFGHPTYCSAGALRLDQLAHEGGPVVRSIKLTAGTQQRFADVRAGVWHRITALVDGTLYDCFYPHRDADTGEVVPRYNGWDDAYV